MKEERLHKILSLLEDYPTEKKAETEKQFDDLHKVLQNNGVIAEKFDKEDEVRFVRYSFLIVGRAMIKKALNLEYEIVVGLNLKSRIRQYLDWERQTIVYEIPKEKWEIVGLKSLLSKPVKNEKETGRYAPIIKMSDEPLCVELSRAPHILLGGRSGSGKSCFLNSLLVSLMARYLPQEVKFVLIDLKRVEFSAYNQLPYLIGRKVFQDTEESFLALESTREELERRFQLFEELSVRNLSEYTEKAKEMDLPRLPHLLVVIDEIADMMLVDKKRATDVLVSLLSRSRAAGIHIIVSTQRAQRDTLPVAVSNLCLTKISMALSAAYDSRVILGEEGAELLHAHGDTLYKDATMQTALRAQTAYISYKEVLRVVDFIKSEE